MSRGTALRLVALALIWGSGFLLITVAGRGLSAVQVTLARLVLGAAILVPLVYARGERLPTGRRLWAQLTVAALLSMAIPYVLFALAQHHVASSLAGMLNATTPLWTFVIAVALGPDRRPGRSRVAGLLLGFAGTVILFAPWQADAGAIASWAGIACLVAAGSYGVGYVFQDRYLTNRGQSPLVLATGQLIAATVLLGLAVPFAGLSAIQFRLDVLVAVLVLGTVGTGVAYVLNYRLITDEGSAASVVIYLLPPVAIALGALVLSEPIALRHLLGTAVILGGVALVRGRPSAAPAGSSR